MSEVVTEAIVSIVDDDASVRKALARVLRSAGLEVVAYASAQEYIDALDPDQPGCLILDLAMPGIGGLDLQAILRSKGTAPPIIFLSGRAVLADGIQAMKEGAVEFLTKPVEDQALFAAVNAAIVKDRVERTARTETAAIRRRVATLTARELQVLRCVLGGMLNKQTAAELGTVEKTIKVHRARVMEKMQVSSLAELVRVSGRAGVIATPAPRAQR
jgi:FixJ family two-component response regulator